MRPMVAAAGRPGRPARLSRELIVAAALRGDLASLTMRELATRLDVSHSALYRWVATAYVEFFRGLPALVVILARWIRRG